MVLTMTLVVHIIAAQVILSIQTSEGHTFKENVASYAKDRERHLENKVKLECELFFNKDGRIKTGVLMEKHKEMDKDGDGAIDFKEFYKWDSDNLDAFNSVVEKIPFYMYDENLDGKVTFKEFIDSLKDMDRNNDGEITQQECSEYETKIYNDSFDMLNESNYDISDISP